MTDYAILDSPGIAAVEAEAVGEAVSEWLRDRGWHGPQVQFCAGYARARVRAAHRGGKPFTVLLELVPETVGGLHEQVSAAGQQLLRELVDSHWESVTAGAVDRHRRRIAGMARRAAGEYVAETVPEAGVAALVWCGVTAESMVLGVGPCSVAIGDPLAVAARAEIAWRQANQGKWSESDFWIWIAAEGQQRALARRVEVMLELAEFEEMGAVA
ncbi:hypothetical protein [Mycolicibacter virginiensis]|uniref:hypothetical protein n=1 Tax=Mycolicibacter virginiensis TaxID=1795032 RepID=UPI001F03CB1A|nr:hypothetical protein [Mycolicibacter virginiensis]ULP48054.1 hypothetical protein MJO54_02460 [Mycolicibacter virginiensis]